MNPSETVRSFQVTTGNERPDTAVRRIAVEWLQATKQSGPAFRLRPLLELAPVPLDPHIVVAPSDFDANITLSGDQYQISVNSEQPFGRQRFSIAHELGHTLFFEHRPQARFRASAASFHQDPVEERLCNIFATEVLMPASEFRAEISGAPISVDSVKGLADLFEVSYQAAAFRVGELSTTSSVVGVFRLPLTGQAPQMLWCARSNQAKHKGSLAVELPRYNKAFDRFSGLHVDLTFSDGTCITAVPATPLKQPFQFAFAADM